MNRQNARVAVSTTTGRQSQPQKVRGHTLTILESLANSGGLTTREIADKTGLSRKLVKDYCRRGYLAEMIEKKEAWGWQISPYGGFVLNINATTTTTTTTTGYTNTTQRLHKGYTKATPNSRQLDLTTFFSQVDLDEAAHAVVDTLASHYERTGQKFRMFQDYYEMADAFGLSFEDLRQALAHLKEEGFVYLRREVLGHKVGLKARLVELISIA